MIVLLPTAVVCKLAKGMQSMHESKKYGQSFFKIGRKPANSVI